MRSLFAILMLLAIPEAKGQELFVFSEPASNMAARSIGIRVKNEFMKRQSTTRYEYFLQPELMWGVSKKIMIHGDLFYSNRGGYFKFEGGSLYTKYRFFSVDEVHSHFRMAAFARGSYNAGHLHEPAIHLEGHNAGYQFGIIATKLHNKIAISAGTSLVHLMDNSNYKFYLPDKHRNALSYNFSVGKLLLPKDYINYKQVNMNGMVEFLGQTNLATGSSYIDMAPSVQFIFESRMRLDFGYRFALVKDLYRLAGEGGLIRLEYNIFNLYK
jgi:hypothetical protein